MFLVEKMKKQGMFKFTKRMAQLLKNGNLSIPKISRFKLKDLIRTLVLKLKDHSSLYQKCG
jgi:hypothetical protein